MFEKCRSILKVDGELLWIIIYYSLPTKLRKGNVFSRACLSVILPTGGSHVTITHNALDLTLQLAPPQPHP